MKHNVLSIVIASALLTATPALVFAQAGAKPATETTQGVPSQLVLSNATRIVGTLEKRRAEFKQNRAALDKFIAGEFNAMFDREYAGRLRHGSDDGHRVFLQRGCAGAQQRTQRRTGEQSSQQRESPHGPPRGGFIGNRLRSAHHGVNYAERTSSPVRRMIRCCRGGFRRGRTL